MLHKNAELNLLWENIWKEAFKLELQQLIDELSTITLIHNYFDNRLIILSTF